MDVRVSRIRLPGPTHTYRAGETITVECFAVDVEDGVISGTNRLVWSSSYLAGVLKRPGAFEDTGDNSPIVCTTPDFGNVEFFLTGWRPGLLKICSGQRWYK